MDTNQAIRLQCLELAVKAGTPWNRLTDTADMLTAYVRGINARVATDQIDSLTPAGLAEYRRTGELSTETAISPADKGVAVEDSPTWPTDMPQDAIEQREALMRNGDFGKTAMLGSALRATFPEDQRGEPVEDVETGTGIYTSPPEKTITRTPGMPLEEPAPQPPGVANDPRLPMVTM